MVCATVCPRSTGFYHDADAATTRRSWVAILSSWPTHMNAAMKAYYLCASRSQETFVVVFRSSSLCLVDSKLHLSEAKRVPCALLPVLGLSEPHRLLSELLLLWLLEEAVSAVRLRSLQAHRVPTPISRSLIEREWLLIVCAPWGDCW